MANNTQQQDAELRGALDILALNDYHQATAISKDVDAVMQLIKARDEQREREIRTQLIEKLYAPTKDGKLPTHIQVGMRAADLKYKEQS